MSRHLNLTIIIICIAALCACDTAKKLTGPDGADIKTAIMQGDCSKALQLAAAGEASNNAAATFYLGRLYAMGCGVKADDATAVRYYKEASDAGYSRATVFLGAANQYGTGTPRNLRDSERLYREAADKGDPQARYLLLQIQGKTDDRNDPAQAERYFQAVRDAADSGDPTAAMFVGMVYMQGAGPVKPDTSLSHKYLDMVAESGTVALGAGAAWTLFTFPTGDSHAPAYMSRYMAAGDYGLMAQYVETCARNPEHQGCDRAQVFKYGLIAERYGKKRMSLPPGYLKSFPRAQVDEAGREVQSWKPVPMPYLSPDFYTDPSLSGVKG